MFELLVILTQIQSQQRQPHSYSIVKEEVFGPLVSCGIMLTFSKAIKDTVQIQLLSTNVNKCKLPSPYLSHQPKIKQSSQIVPAFAHSENIIVHTQGSFLFIDLTI